MALHLLPGQASGQLGPAGAHHPRIRLLAGAVPFLWPTCCAVSLTSIAMSHRELQAIMHDMNGLVSIVFKSACTLCMVGVSVGRGMGTGQQRGGAAALVARAGGPAGRQLGRLGVQLLDAALVPPAKGTPPHQIAVLAGSSPSSSGNGEVRVSSLACPLVLLLNLLGLHQRSCQWGQLFGVVTSRQCEGVYPDNHQKVCLSSIHIVQECVHAQLSVHVLDFGRGTPVMRFWQRLDGVQAGSDALPRCCAGTCAEALLVWWPRGSAVAWTPEAGTSAPGICNSSSSA